MACDDFNSCEHFEIIGNPIDEPDPIWGGIGFDDGSGGGSGGDHDDGGGSGGGGSNSGDQKSERQQCHERVQRENHDCENTAFSNYSHESGYCQDMAFDPDNTYEDIVNCQTEMTYRYNYDIEQCTLRLDDDIRFCNQHFSD